jgi:predicted anti-sigma-YlaC factor YlaD
MTIDMVQHNTGAAARNSSLQIAETMALHQTIKSQVEEITKLHQTIQDQISITDKQSKSIRWLSYLVAALTIVQTAVTVVQAFPNKSSQPAQTECVKQ